MKIKDCLNIISECVGYGLEIKFDYLTSADKIVMLPNGAITHYEFGGDTAIGKLMELYEQLETGE